MNTLAQKILASAMAPSALEEVASSVLGTCLQLPEGEELEHLMAYCREDQILPWTEVAERRNLFRLMGQEVLPTSELSVVCGKAKSGKTFFSSILIAAGLTPTRCRLVEVERMDDAPLRMLWFDTEQSRQSSKEILCQRILPLAQLAAEAFDPERLCVTNTTARDYQTRLQELILQALTMRPELIVVDGIVDLISSINDEAQARQIVQQLRTLARHLDCAVLCVIHQNKAAEDNTLRGWVGTEAINKCFEMWELRKNQDTREFSVQLSHSRGGADPEELKFGVTNNLPKSLVPPQMGDRTEDDELAEGEAGPANVTRHRLQTFWRQPDGKYDMQRIVFTLLPEGERIRAGVFFSQLRNLLQVSTNTATKLIDIAIVSKLISKIPISGREVYYCRYDPNIPGMPKDPEIPGMS